MAEAEASNQQRIQVQRKLTTRSGVWDHFTRFTDEDGQPKARCKLCSQVLGADTKNGTSSLRAHWKRHEKRQEIELLPEPQPQQQPQPQPGPQDAAVGDLARMIALHGFDPSIIEEYYFRSFNPNFEVPSRLAVEGMCDAIFDETRKDIFSRMKDVPGRVSLAVGTVRTIEGNVLYTACHYIDDEWNLHKVIMDAYVDLPFRDYHGPLLGVDGVCLDPDHNEIPIDRVVYDFSEREVFDNLFMTVWEIKSDDVLDELKNEIYKIYGFNTIPNWSELICTTYIDKEFHSIC